MMSSTIEPFLLAEQLINLAFESPLPRDLPGRYGRVIKDLERLLTAADALSVVAGGWAVWRHGYAGRVTQDVDIVVAKQHIGSLRRLAYSFGFDFLTPPKGRWPKMSHRTTQIEVDLLPEASIPGTPSRPAPVPIGHPADYHAIAGSLQFISLAGLIELKLGAGRAKDTADLVELIKANRAGLDLILDHLETVHPSYPERFSALIRQADEE